jgi:uncharacterized protein DUF551
MEWISFKKKRPNKKKHQEVITFEYLRDSDTDELIPHISIEQTSSIYYDEDGVCTDAGGNNLTHWMPLPELPDEVD